VVLEPTLAIILEGARVQRKNESPYIAHASNETL